MCSVSVTVFLSITAVLTVTDLCEASPQFSYFRYHPKPTSFRRQDFPRFLAYTHSTESSDEEPENGLEFNNPYISKGIKRIRSKSMCPTEFERFDPITQACYEVGTEGPCEPLMVYKGNEYLNPEDRIYGHCECDQGRYDRPMVSVRGKCYFLYTQAICKTGYFLVVEPSMYGAKPACQLNPCGNAQKHSTTELVPFKEHCVKLNSPSILCPQKDDTVTFRKGSFQPVCATTTDSTTSRRIFRRQITKTNELKCQGGYGKVRGSSRCYRLVRIAKSNSR